MLTIIQYKQKTILADITDNPCLTGILYTLPYT